MRGERRDGTRRDAKGGRREGEPDELEFDERSKETPCYRSIGVSSLAVLDSREHVGAVGTRGRRVKINPLSPLARIRTMRELT